MSDDLLDSGIAIVGMAGRFPGARDVETFWQNIRNGVESIRPLSDDELRAAGVDEATLRDPDYVKAAGVLDDVPMFDAGYFGVSLKDAAIMDPQHRHFLECAVTAFEHAGYAPRRFPGAIGVFAGCGMNAYFLNNVLTNPDLVRTVGFFLLRHTGNDRDFLPTTVSYKLDLRGPSMAIQTACSTSLVAIHTACQSLLAGECEMALAGGSTILVPHGHGYFYRENEPVSPDGHCRPFSSDSEGTVVSSGVGAVVLKRLADALEAGDTVHAVIRGSAVNNDGAGKIGYLAPSVGGHAGVVAEALSLAGVTADTIDYVEAHGTGTAVGDPIEIAALTQGFRETTDRVGYCRIGSVKSNIGHLDTAAGVASLIKVAKALDAAEMPPSLHFKAPNPQIDFASSPFEVNAELRSWPANGTPRRAGVSSLGIGGTNAHVVLEQAPALPPVSAATRPVQVFPLSAKTASALDNAGQNLAGWLRTAEPARLPDAAFTLQEGRETWDHRRVVVAASGEEAAAALETKDSVRTFSGKREGDVKGVAFMFSGAGSQHPGMARGLYESEPVFRREMDRCLDIARGLLDYDLAAVIYPPPGSEAAAETALELPSRLCPAVFATEWALAQLWQSWGIEPAAMIGHSLGEYAAACVAGVMSLEDAVRMVVLRGRLIDRLSGGAMLSLALPEEEARALIGDELDLAAVNAPGLCVVSGAIEAVERLQQRLVEQGLEGRLIPVNAAGHSRHLDPILEEFRRGIAGIRLQPPQIRYVSNVTGAWVRDEDACDPDYWVRHLRGTVRFADGLGTLLAQPDLALLEVGPGQTLCAFARQHPVKPRGIVPSLRKRSDDVSDQHAALGAFGRLWVAGVSVDWERLRADERRRRIPLPTYPFEHKPYWIEPGRPAAQEAEPLARLERLERLDDWFRRAVWEPASPQAAPSGAGPVTWLVFLDAAGVGARAAQGLREKGQRVVTVAMGDAFVRDGELAFRLAPELGRAGYDELVNALVESELLPSRIAHFWGLTEDESFRPGSSFRDRNQECGFYSLLYLLQALADTADTLPARITVFSNGMQAVADGEPLAYPDKATLLGPVRVAPHEFAGVHCRSVDIDLAVADTSAGLFARWRRNGRSLQSIESLADAALAELGDESDSAVVAWRNGQRYVETWATRTPAPGSAAQPRFREGGVYLVTGGLGGIGFALGEQIARQYRSTVLLLGRTGMPDEDRWDQWLAGHGERDRNSRRIRTIRDVRAAGGDLVPVRGDLADRDRMETVIAELKARFGTIHGVLHAAGGIEDGVIQAKTQASAERVFAAKLHGTLLLDELLADTALDFFLVFSSTSAVLGPPGQVDYVGANAFLNAFAESRTRRGAFTAAVGWGVWNEVGGASELSHRKRGEPLDLDLCRLTGHPLLGDCVAEGPEGWSWEAAWRAGEQWVLDDHRNQNRVALLPGTGYLELARAAFSDAVGDLPVRLTDVAFLAPLPVADDETRRVGVRLMPDGRGFEFSVSSLDTAEVHATGRVEALRGRAPAAVDVNRLRARCRNQRQEAKPGAALQSSQEATLAFGPRWSVLRCVAFGDGEAVARLSLAPSLANDVQGLPLHPALLDIATGFALPLIPGWKAGQSLYVPLAYSSVSVFGPLTDEVVSHVRVRPETGAVGEVATFDVTVCDPRGHVLVQVEGYQMRRLEPGAGFGSIGGGRPARRAQHPGSEAERVFLETFESGIRVADGFEALVRVLGDARGGAHLVSSIDVDHWRARLDRACAAETETSGVKFARPELDSEYEGPRNALEKGLAEIWEELLGVDQVGIHDDFFDLGGHSLIAVRMFARVKKQWGVDWPISMLFDAPSIAQFAALLAGEVGDGGDPDESERPAERSVRRRFLVSMNKASGSDRAPLFLVAGMFGNVLNLRHLAAHLGDDQPVYGLQAKGLYGDDEPHRRFEDAARDYLAEIRQVQPHGPYRIGGFSGGGVTAYEMAHQLLAEGEEVAALVLLDAVPPHPAWPLPSKADYLAMHWQRLTREGPLYLIRRLQNRIRWEFEQRERRRGSPNQGATPAEFRSELIEAAFREALDHYRMRPYPGKAHLFRPPLDRSYELSGGRIANKDRQLIEYENWWGPWINGGLEVLMVPGNHDTMVLEPNVGILAKKVRAVLDAAHVTEVEAPMAEPEPAPVRAMAS